MTIEEMAEKLDAINNNPKSGMDGSELSLIKELKPYGITIIYLSTLKAWSLIQIKYVDQAHTVHKVD